MPKGYITRTVNGRRTYQHILEVEEAMGKRLPIGAIVHHWDNDGTNNDHPNLLVCPDQEYHKLIHRRMEAYDACGHADWVKCWMCQQWAPKHTMSSMKRTGKTSSTYYHVECRAKRGF